jgi:hypothetical protein
VTRTCHNECGRVPVMLAVSEGAPDVELAEERSLEWADDRLDPLRRRRPLRRAGRRRS